jgi:hypothetical protein
MLLWREIKDNEMGGACSTLGEEKCIQNFGFKDLGKTPLGIFLLRSEDSIGLGLWNLGCGLDSAGSWFNGELFCTWL